MYPVLFELGPIKIYSYGLMLALAFIISALLARRQAPRYGLPPEAVLNLVLVAAISGILGARIMYILQNLNYYSRYPSQIIMLQRGGLSFYGGFILALISVAIFLKRVRVPIPKTFDLLAPYLALAQAIGRIGCLLNGCCYGRAANYFLAIRFPGEFIARHPTQIYASLSLLLIFIILRIGQERSKKRKYFPGKIFLLYCLSYSIFRFFIEYLRAGHPIVWANFTVYQLISAAIFLISCILLSRPWISFRCRSRRPTKA